MGWGEGPMPTLQHTCAAFYNTEIKSFSKIERSPYWRPRLTVGFFLFVWFSPLSPRYSWPVGCCWCDAGMLSGCQVVIHGPCYLLRGANEVLVSTCRAAVTQLFLNNPPICLPLSWPAATPRPPQLLNIYLFIGPPFNLYNLIVPSIRLLSDWVRGSLPWMNIATSALRIQTLRSLSLSLNNICSAVNSKLHSPHWTIACRQDG